MANKFIFFENFKNIADGLDDKTRLKYYDALTDYVFHSKESDDLVIKALITAIKPSLERHTNWGGARTGAGRPRNNQNNQNIQDEKLEKEENQDENLNNQDFQVFKKNETEEKEKTNKKEKADELLRGMFNKNSNQLVISDSFSIPVDEEPFCMYARELGVEIIRQVERWLIKNKRGAAVDKRFICEQFTNFARRQGKPLLRPT